MQRRGKEHSVFKELTEKWCSGDLIKQDRVLMELEGEAGARPHWGCRLREGVRVSTVNFQCLLLSSQCW